MKYWIAVVMLLGAECILAQNGDFHLEQEYPISPAGQISLRTIDAQVTITGSARANVRVKIDRTETWRGWGRRERGFGIDVQNSNGNLTISEHKEAAEILLTGLSKKDYRVELEVPAGTKLLIRGDDGSYSVSNMTAAISIRVNDAKVTLTNCTGQDFQFALDDGDLDMDQARGTLELVADDGRITITNAQLDQVNARLGDGTIRIATGLTDQGAYKINCQDGAVTFTVTGGGGVFNIHHSNARIKPEGAFSVVRKSENFVQYQVGAGKALVDITTDGASVQLISRK